MIEKSRVPVWLSAIAPIYISAITLGFVVFSRGEMDEQTRRHETIHFQQFLETLFVGFILLYIWDYLVGLFRHQNGVEAYHKIRAEREAYTHDDNEVYLFNRKRYAWIFAKDKSK